MNLILDRSKVGQKDRFWIKDETDEIDYDSSKQAFEIPRFNPKTVDLNKVPTNAQEYLEQVIAERLLLPKVTVPKQYKGEETYDQNGNTTLNNNEQEGRKQYVGIVDDDPNKPTIEWMKKEIDKFTHLRIFVTQISHLFKPGSHLPEWPSISDKKGWLKYLYSCDDYDENDLQDNESGHDVEFNHVSNSDEDYDDYYDSGSDFDHDIEASNCAITTIKNTKCNDCSEETKLVNKDFNPTPPLVSTVLRMDETLKENLIGYIVEWICDGILTLFSGSLWLYALFACIKFPASPNVIHHARIVAKIAIKLRRKMDKKNISHKREIIAQNLMICIISKFLGQHDLADYEAIFD